MFQKNVSLKRYSSFKIGGPAKYFYVSQSSLRARGVEDLIRALEKARKLKIPVFVLGKGTNVLFDDKGYKGLIIKIQDSTVTARDNKVFTGAGCSLKKLLNFCLKKNLTGLEWTAGIPGTLAGAIYNNSGAFGNEIKDAVKEVWSLDIKPCQKRGKDFSIIKRNNFQCDFGYRKSIFIKNKDIILKVVLELRAGDKKKIANRIKRIIDYRKKHHPLEFPSIGSVFKNPVIFENSAAIRVSAAELIERAGLKGKVFGGAMISSKHANFIVNFNRAKSSEVKFLINLAKKQVKKKFGIVLEEEIVILNQA